VREAANLGEPEVSGAGFAAVLKPHPGDDGGFDLEVRAAPGLGRGRHEARIVLPYRCSDGSSGQVIVPASLSVQPDIFIAPHKVVLTGTTRDRAERRGLVVRASRPGPPFKISRVEIEPPTLRDRTQVRLDTMKAGEVSLVDLSFLPGDRSWEAAGGTVRIVTDHPQFPDLKVPIAVQPSASKLPATVPDPAQSGAQPTLAGSRPTVRPP
jgi:hypothetical protein